MQFSIQELRALVAEASSIDERLRMQMVPDNLPGNQERLQARWENWCQTLTQGNRTLFLRRLAWDNLQEERVRGILGTVQWPEEEPLPAWTELLQEALQTTTALADRPETCSFFDPANPQPFEHLLAPFVLVAWTRLRAQAGAAYDLLNEQAHLSLQRELLATLASYV